MQVDQHGVFGQEIIDLLRSGGREAQFRQNFLQSLNLAEQKGQRRSMGLTLGIAAEPKLPPTSVHRSQPLVAAGVLPRIAGPLMLEGRAKVLGVEAQPDRIIETLESRLSGRLQLKAGERSASGQNPVM